MKKPFKAATLILTAALVLVTATGCRKNMDDIIPDKGSTQITATDNGGNKSAPVTTQAPVTHEATPTPEPERPYDAFELKGSISDETEMGKFLLDTEQNCKVNSASYTFSYGDTSFTGTYAYANKDGERVVTYLPYEGAFIITDSLGAVSSAVSSYIYCYINDDNTRTILVPTDTTEMEFVADNYMRAKTDTEQDFERAYHASMMASRLFRVCDGLTEIYNGWLQTGDSVMAAPIIIPITNPQYRLYEWISSDVIEELDRTDYTGIMNVSIQKDSAGNDYILSISADFTDYSNTHLLSVEVFMPASGERSYKTMQELALTAVIR